MALCRVISVVIRNKLLQSCNKPELRCFMVTSPSSSQQPKLRTPYIIFANEKMGNLRQANPGIRVPELGRMLGQMWRLLSDDDKDIYKMQYQEQKDVYDVEKKTHLDSLTAEEKEQLIAKAKLQRNKKILRRRRKLSKELKKPKVGDVNPFVLFLKSKTMDRGEAPFAQFVKGIAEHWKKMPEDDKEPYVQTARANSIKYRQKLVEWEQKMIAQGHQDVVRKGTLKRASRTSRTKSRPRKSVKAVAGPLKKASKTNKDTESPGKTGEKGNKPTGNTPGKSTVDKPKATGEKSKKPTKKTPENEAVSTSEESGSERNSSDKRKKQPKSPKKPEQ